MIAILAAIQITGMVTVYLVRRIKPNTVLLVRIEGEIPEQPRQDALTQLLIGVPTSVTELVEGLERARADPRITGIEVRVGESTMSMAKMQEIHDKIREFNRAGKFSVAYLDFATNGPYYVASACQNVFLLPKSMLYVRGVMASTTFLRGTLDKLDIYPDLLHIGEYKTASNIYTEKKYTSAHREANEALLEDWYQIFLRGIAEGRGMKVEQVEQAIRKGPFNSQQALELNLVDRVGYADEVREFVKQKNHGSESRLSLRRYVQRTRRAGRRKLAVIYATGVILPGRSGDSLFGETFMGAETVSEQLRRAREDAGVKAVLLRVDSPGGSAFASEVIRHEVELTRRVKPVVVSMSDVAASGGYWISMSASQIVAEAGTITGSIGVIAGKFNLRGLYEKLGLSKDFVALTENATLDWPFQNYTPAQRQAVKNYMQDIYDNFVRGVAEGRGKRFEEVDRIARGRVWTGQRAYQLGLVDALGGLHTALAVAKKLAGISPGEEVALVFLPPPRTLAERIWDLFDELRAPESCVTPFAWLKSAESLAREPVWALLPDVPQLR